MTRRDALKTLSLGAAGTLISTETLDSAELIQRDDILVLTLQDRTIDPHLMAKQIAKALPELKGRFMIVNGADATVVRGKVKV